MDKYTLPPHVVNELNNALQAALKNGLLTAAPGSILPPIALTGLKQSIQAIPLILAQAQHIDDLFKRLPATALADVLKTIPAWFNDYGLPPFLHMFKQGAQMGALDANFFQLWAAPNPAEAFTTASTQALAENASEIRSLLAHKGPLALRETTDEEKNQISNILAGHRALTSGVRCMVTFGQPMSELIRAGCNGNDEGFIRALQIDDSCLAHPAIIGRMSAAKLTRQDAVVASFQQAALEGVSKKISKELNECRFALGTLRQAGLLQRFNAEQLYELMCVELAIYPTEGRKDPAASLHTFVQRWESSLVQ